jgi:copper(I)-binding protein
MAILSRRAALCAMLLPLAPAARAQQAGTVTVSAPWTRAAGAGGTGAGFMTLRNTGSAPDRIVAVRSPAARAAELHTHIREGDVMRMRPVAAIDLPAGQEVRLQPGGQHIMLVQLTGPLRQGERVLVTLVLERGGEIEVQLPVESAGARAPSAHQH